MQPCERSGAVLSYPDIWAILIGFLIRSQLPDSLSVTGISILVSAGLYTFYREQQLRRRRARRMAGAIDPR